MDLSKDSKIETNQLLQSIFIICDYLVETNNLNILVFIIISIIEFLQNLFFFINPIFEKYWDNTYFFEKVANLIKYFWIDQIFVGTDRFQTFLIFFYVFIAVILLFALDIAYLLISLRKNYPIHLIPSFFLQLIINIFLPVLFIPMLSSFLSVFICYSNVPSENLLNGNPSNSSNSSLRSLEIQNFFYLNTICFNSSYILHCVFGGCGIITICTFGYLLSLIFYETNPKSRNIKSRFSSSFERCFYIIKIAWVVIYHLSSYFPEERQWIIVLTNFLCTLIPFCILISEKPYYNITVQKILLVFRTIELLTGIILLISLIIGENNFKGEWILFFTGILLIIGVYFIFIDNKFKIIILNLESIKDEILFQKKLVYTFDLVENQDQMEFELFLKGYVMTNNSTDTSNYLNTLKHKVETIAMTPNEKCKKHAEEYYIFQKYINECYKKGLKKFPQSNSLKLNYLLFSIRYLQNPQISMVIMKQIEPRQLKFEELFIYYRYTKIIEERLIVHNPNAVKVDINFEITYKRNKNIFMRLIESTTQNLIDFWDVISRENIQFRTIEDLVYQINVNLETISLIWKEIQRLKTNDNKLICLYEKFLKNVLNDEQGCEELLSKYNDVQGGGINNEENLLGDYESYIQDGSGYAIVSGNTESFGKIIAFNVAMARIFNYTIEEMKSLNMNSLMPDIYKEEHNNRLLVLIMGDDSKDKSTKHFGQSNSVGLCKNGYVLPINNTMTILNGINDNINFLTLVRRPPSDNFKPYPVYFVTDLNFDIHHVSAQAIPLFGINSNNICLNSTQHGKEYLNLTVLIKDLELIRQDKGLIDNYKTGQLVNQKKKIVIDNLDKVNEILNQAAESNKAVKLLSDESINNISEGIEYSLNKTILPKFNRNYTQFYMSLSSAQIGFTNLGYIIKLDPIKEDRFYYDDKSTIVYEDNILSFNPHTHVFYDPLKADDDLIDYQPNNLKGENLTQKMVIKQTNLFKKRKQPDVDVQGQAHANLLNYLFKKKNIKNYCEIGKVKTIIRVQGRPDKEILPTSVMKINETIKKLDVLLKASKGKEINIFEEEKNEEQALLEKSTEDLLNFKGIEGWEVVYNKIKAAKIPKEITIIRVISISFLFIKLAAIIGFYICHIGNLNILEEISVIGNYSLYHAHYIIDSIHRSEMFIYYYSLKTPAGEEAFKAVNTTLVSNIANIINITNSLRQQSNIDKPEYKIYQNRSFLLLNSEGINQQVEMNLIEVFIQLINKLIGMSYNNLEPEAIQDQQIQNNFYLFFFNANNSYMFSILDVLISISEFFHLKLNTINDYLVKIMFIALVLLLICAINTFYSLKIISLKRKITDLFFTIPEKICWKYHSNCEMFLRYLIDGDNIPLEKEQIDDNRNSAINNLIANANNGNNDDEKKTFIAKRSFHSSSIINNSKSDIMKVISINLLLCLIDYSFYGFNTIAFQSKLAYLKGIEQYITGLFLLKMDFNLYIINQRQIYNKSNILIMNTSNIEFQTTHYLDNLKYYDNFLLMIYNNSITLFQSNHSIYSYDVFDIFNIGICDQEEFAKICQKIPVNMRGLDLILKSTFENFTTIYVNYASNPTATSPKFDEKEYGDLNDIVIDYINLVANHFHQSIITILNDYIANVKKIASLSLGLYITLTICIFLLYWFFYQNRSLQDIIFSKTTLLLIHPKDVKDIRSIMDFLQKEVYKLNSNS